jgi:excisionase family DNA binding protein
VTVPEAARRLGISAATLRGQIGNGRLLARKVGRDWDVSDEEVARYRLESRGRPGRRATQPTLGLMGD